MFSQDFNLAMPDAPTSQDPVNKRNFSKVSSKSKFRKEISNKRFAGNIDQSDMDFEESNSKICDQSLSCENAGSSNS